MSARTVTGPELAALLTRLDHLPAAGSCSPRHQRFTLGQLDPATVGLLAILSHH